MKKLIFGLILMTMLLFGCSSVVEDENITVAEPEKEEVTVEEPLVTYTTVCQDGSCDYSSISLAVESASDGDEIRVMDKGVYSDEEINIRPEDPINNVIIDCNGATLDGTATGGTPFRVSQVTGIQIKNCIIKNHANGITFDRVTDGKIIGNKMSEMGTGIVLTTTTNVEVRGNEVTMSKQGIQVSTSNGNKIIGNTITDNTGVAISEFNSENEEVSDNIIKNNGGNGLRIRAQGTVVKNNEVVGSGFYGLECGAKDLVLEGNDVSGNEKGNYYGCEEWGLE